MTGSPDLFDCLSNEPYRAEPSAPYVPGSKSSKDGARRVEPVIVSLEEQVFNDLRHCGKHGATCEEIERRTKLKHQTVSARLRGLELANRVRKTGERRKNISGVSAGIYVIVEVAA